MSSATDDLAVSEGAARRERRRAKQATAIERIALALFAERGFTAVTVDDIADAADISSRTFFRYFPSKEDVLFGDRQRFESTVAAALEQEGPESSAVDALRRGLVDVSRAVDADLEGTRLRLQIMEQSPATMAAAFAQQRTYESRLIPLVAARMDLDVRGNMRPALVVHVFLAATNVAVWHWLSQGATTPLHELVEQALTAIVVDLQPPAQSATRRRLRGSRVS